MMQTGNFKIHILFKGQTPKMYAYKPFINQFSTKKKKEHKYNINKEVHEFKAGSSIHHVKIRKLLSAAIDNRKKKTVPGRIKIPRTQNARKWKHTTEI